MSDLAKNVISASPYQSESADYRRSCAVAAALEVISIFAASGSSQFSMTTQMGKLSGYADIIEEALKVK